MKKKIIIVICVLFVLVGSACAVDMYRMSNNEPVVFSTWGRKYTPPLEESLMHHIEYDEAYTPAYAPTGDVQPGGNVVDDWGLHVSAIDITPSGLKLVVVNSNDNPVGFGYGSYYWLEQRIDNEWVTVEFAPQEHDIGWTTELYMLNPNDITTIGINWEWLYGKLPAGHYRVGKTIDNFIKSQKGEPRTYYVEFIID